jgi:hypothetical protein
MHKIVWLEIAGYGDVHAFVVMAARGLKVEPSFGDIFGVAKFLRITVIQGENADRLREFDSRRFATIRPARADAIKIHALDKCTILASSAIG